MFSALEHPAHPPISESLEDRRLLSAALTLTFPGRLPKELPVDGTSSIVVRLTNHGSSIAQGPAQVQLFASTESTVDAGELLLTSKSLNVRLRPRASEDVRLTFPTPTTLTSGAYNLLADLAGPASSIGTPVAASSPAPVSIQSPFSDLSLQFATLPSQPIEIDGASAGKRIATVFVINTGNLPVRGKVDVSLYLSTDNVLDSSDPLLATAKNRPIALKPGGHGVTGFRIAVPPGTAAGGYFLIAEMTPAGTLVDSNAADNLATSPRRVAVVTKLPLKQARNQSGSVGEGASVSAGGGGVVTVVCPPDDSNCDDSTDDSGQTGDDGSDDSSSDSSSDSCDPSSSDSTTSPPTSSSDSTSDGSSDSSDSGSGGDDGDF